MLVGGTTLSFYQIEVLASLVRLYFTLLRSFFKLFPTQQLTKVYLYEFRHRTSCDSLNSSNEETTFPEPNLLDNATATIATNSCNAQLVSNTDEDNDCDLIATFATFATNDSNPSLTLLDLKARGFFLQPVGLLVDVTISG